MFIQKENSKVLAIGAHPDDIELGAGGFLYRLHKEMNCDIHFLVLTHGEKNIFGEPDFEKNNRTREACEAYCCLFEKDISEINRHLIIFDFEDCNLNTYGHKPIKIIEEAVLRIEPSLILCHTKADRHSDHRTVNEAVISACRYFKGDILFYSAPSTIVNDFNVNFFVTLNEEELDRKYDSLMKHGTQKNKPYFTKEYLVRKGQPYIDFFQLPQDAKLEVFQIYQSFYN